MEENIYRTTIKCPFCGAVKVMEFSTRTVEGLNGKWMFWARTSEELHKHFNECDLYQKHYRDGEYND